MLLKCLKQPTDCHAIWRTRELLRWEQDVHCFIHNPEVLDPRLRTARFVAHSCICRNVLGCMEGEGGGGVVVVGAQVVVYVYVGQELQICEW
jgi:hypothetical protein